LPNPDEGAWFGGFHRDIIGKPQGNAILHVGSSDASFYALVQRNKGQAQQSAAHAQDRGRTSGNSSKELADSTNGAAKSAAIDPELASLVANWHLIPGILRSAILVIARHHLPAQ